MDSSRFGPAVRVRHCQEVRFPETSERQLTSGENVSSLPRTIHRPAASKITPSTSFRLNLPRPQMTINWLRWLLPQVSDAPEALRILAGLRFNPAPFIPTLKLPDLRDPWSRTRARLILLLYCYGVLETGCFLSSTNCARIRCQGTAWLPLVNAGDTLNLTPVDGAQQCTSTVGPRYNDMSRSGIQWCP